MTLEPGPVILSLGLLLCLALLTVPLAAAALFSGMTLLLLDPHPLHADFVVEYSLAMRLDSPSLISIPLFALAGELAVAAGITARLFTVADALGRYGHRNLVTRMILGCALFASVSGVGPAAVAGEGGRLLPAMTRAGLSRETAGGIVACAASLGIVIPASVPLTVYAACSGLPTNSVFAASFIPGLLMALALVLASLFLFRFRKREGHGLRGGRNVSLRTALWKARWSLLMPLMVLASLFSGFFTAPEAAAFSCLYAVAVGRFAHRCLFWSEAWRLFGRTAAVASAILLMVGMGGLLLTLATKGGIAVAFAEAVFLHAGGKAGAVAVMNVVLLLAGCFLDTPVIIVLLVPFMFPLASLCGMPAAHFGVMAVMNLAIGLVTPPQACNVAAAVALTGGGVWRTARAALPLIFVMLASLLAVASIPETSLWLPTLLGWPT